MEAGDKNDTPERLGERTKEKSLEHGKAVSTQGRRRGAWGGHAIGSPAPAPACCRAAATAASIVASGGGGGGMKRPPHPENLRGPRRTGGK